MAWMMEWPGTAAIGLTNHEAEFSLHSTPIRKLRMFRILTEYRVFFYLKLYR